jgi:hypothetical protein
MKFVCLFGFILSIHTVSAQYKNELPFIEHLIDKQFYKEAIHLIDANFKNYNKKQQQDSLNFYEGWAHYSLKNLDQSTNSFLKVGKESSFYLKSRFFAGYNQAYSQNYDVARKIFSQINGGDETTLSLVNFELCGVSMLQGDWSNASHELEQLNSKIASINEQVSALKQITVEHGKHRLKSPLLAGIMSGIIPGSGKIYVGRTGQGIAAMIATTGFGLITWENYRKLGIGHFKTIFFGSIFAANYVSNIYGSVISVRINENEYQDAIHNQILFQLHIPLRNFFE